MLPAPNIPTLLCPPCPIPLAPCSVSIALRAFSPRGLFNKTFPFPVPIPLPLPLPFLSCLPLPLPVLSCLPFPVLIHCSLPFPGSILTPMGVVLTLAVIIVFAITRTALSTARRSGICPVLIIPILVDHAMRTQWSNDQEVPWFVLPAGWWLNLSPGIIATIPREALASAFNHP